MEIICFKGGRKHPLNRISSLFVLTTADTQRRKNELNGDSTLQMSFMKPTDYLARGSVPLVLEEEDWAVLPTPQEPEQIHDSSILRETEIY